ncbi:tetratricopeptide repeat protein [Vibrio tubiashii]|uniref:tetratricopeptide repeat protein n=1 Tax=Vibrio tubiashii TaxID=29498 RepID=UPI001EFCD4C2|nr:tetratricopeptide repeat protein [Vibrio tubiashii]MCG9583218.1 tetratricopeptide repeat protein [Vibrio tubiashii]MCG9616812.1 tetratricopeptide repeat protein [Vibrio tubiashii]MCG9687850.1 tetratricopeptide repeat protein [Vibrio tubiashii]
MVKVRWKRLLGALLVLFSAPLWANTLYSSAVLSEANSLVNIVPKQAKQLATDYLTQRTLTDKTEKSPSAISRDEADSRTRTPGGTIDALRILARAEFNLGNQLEALSLLKEAKSLAETYKLPYLLLDLKLVEIRLTWRIQGNGDSARDKLAQIEEEFSLIDNPQQLARGLKYRMTMLKAEIASAEGNLKLADQLYAEVKPYVDNSKSIHTVIEYHTTVGKQLLANKKYNRALSELLISYWTAIETDSARQLAEVNRILGQLFYDRRVLDKANDHFSQAADFYDNYENSPALAPLLKRMGDIYYYQGKYNLALVHYFNAMDHERLQNNIESVIDIRISLATTYLHLVNYTLAEQYLERAQELLQYADIPRLKAYALLLEAGLARHKQEPKKVLESANQALEIAQQLQDISMQKSAYQMLYLGYELNGQYQQALEYLKHYNSLATIEQQELDLISEDAFRQQKEFVEQTLHLSGQQQELEETHNEYRKFQKITFTLFVLSALLFIFILRRGHVINVQKDELDVLNEDLYTHSRSGLKNLRMLNAKLPASLEESSHKFEKWHVGELIHEPLNDRLRFVMIDVPFLRNMYLQHGYQEGLKLERAFGDYLKQRVEHPARIYHFSDANLLYIEPNSERNTDPEQLFEKIQQWILEFEPDRLLNRIIRIGMADYPFLPRAYTAVNDKELVDVLLMSTSTARTLSMKEHSSQWVYLKAIENAPAASLATGNIRKACKHSINQGLIKVHSSFKNEDGIKKLLKDE